MPSPPLWTAPRYHDFVEEYGWDVREVKWREAIEAAGFSLATNGGLNAIYFAGDICWDEPKRRIRHAKNDWLKTQVYEYLAGDPETTEAYYGLADVRDAAYDTAYTNWTAYKAGGSKQDYQATYGTYQAAADAVQAYWDTVKGTQAAHELDLCQDITEVLVAAGVDNSYGTCE